MKQDNRTYHRWRTTEINHLIATFPAHSDAQYAETFNTSVSAIKTRRAKLGLKREKYARPKGPFTRKPRLI